MDISKLLSSSAHADVPRSREGHNFRVSTSPVSAYTTSNSTSTPPRHSRSLSTGHHAPMPNVRPLPSFSTLTSGAPSPMAQASSGTKEVKKPKPFRCTVDGCEATFGQKGSLTRHVKSRHEKLRPHTCEQCQKSFSALWTLRVHQRNVHLKSKPHKCHLCDKSFGELFNKSKHIAIVHEGKRPFSCPICSRAFGYKGDMRKHVMELHEQAGRPYQCMVPSCGVKFARKRYLRRHENLSHKGGAASASASANRGASEHGGRERTASNVQTAAPPPPLFLGRAASAAGAGGLPASNNAASAAGAGSSALTTRSVHQRQPVSILAPNRY